MTESTTTSRILHLLSLLQTRRYWSGDELARRLGVSGRTLRRDIERLRDLGYVVNANRGVDGGYQLDAGTDLPPLVFTDEEAVALAVSLRTSSALDGIADLNVAALAKLEQVLPSRLRGRIAALAAATTPTMPPRVSAAVDTEVLAVLALACRNSERLRLRYSSATGEESRRQVEPVRLVWHAGRWYLVCWDLQRADWRTLRVDRVDEVFETRVRFTPREVPGGDAAAFVLDRLGGLPTGVTARVRIDAPIETVREWMGAYSDHVEADGDRTVWSPSDRYLEPLAGALFWLRWPFEVLGPPELVELLEGHDRLRIRRSGGAAEGARRKMEDPLMTRSDEGVHG